MNTQLIDLLAVKEFDGARLVLQSNLEKGELFDPRTDRLWAPIADSIATVIRDEHGLDATIPFWEELLKFFTQTIEPVWGHAHKGHIYFRLALPAGRYDFTKARNYLKLAREEDFILQRGIGGSEEDIAFRAQQSSSHVALALLERIEDKDFSSGEEKKQFTDNLFGPSFDAAINGKAIIPSLVISALKGIVPDEAQAMSLYLYRELSIATDHNLSFATVSLTGTVLESILLGVLMYRNKVNSLPNGKLIHEVELGPLLNEAISQGAFPNTRVQATMQLVHIFRNRLHPGNELKQNHKLTERISTTLKIMFELALIDWKQSIHNLNDPASPRIIK